MTEAMQLEIRRPSGSSETHPIKCGVYPMGSEKGNKIVIPDSNVDRRHAILILHQEGFWVEDLKSRIGTLLDGKPVAGRAAILPGQEIGIGSYTLILRSPAGAPLPAPPPEAPPPKMEKEKPPIRPETGSRPAAPDSTAAKFHEPSRQDSLREQKQQIKKQIHEELLERLDIKRLTASHIKETELHERTLKMLEQIVQDIQTRLPSWIEPQALIKEIYDEAVGLGPLEDLLSNQEITEIMVNRNDQIYVEKQGKLTLTDRAFMDDSSVLAIMERIVAPIGRRIDESQPYVDARLKDGSRVNAIIPPLALSGPCLTIRKFSKDPLTIEDLIRFGTIDPRMADFLRRCVLLRKNVIVAGGTGSGKTTFLNIMGSFLPDTDRIVTIEDSAELRLPQSHVVRLESRPPNIEGRGAVTIRDLLRNALRMRPDRLVIGECRSGETLDMLQAMNTGHDGSMTTVHANTPRDVISRLETMTLMSGVDLPTRAIREQIGSAIHLVIQTSRLSDGSRKVTNITEISGLEGDRITMQDLFIFVQTGIDQKGKVQGYMTATGSVPTFMEEFKTRGLSVDMNMFNQRLWTH
ncbi:MAG: Flp pilus assembly complex ATPase component TadA [Verrucomicrobia bacterium]|nr:Flp pilus assembly complex ATPase component TadA [Verrucomicrobiota bacterium]MCG2680773.1 Flp pilus assembly complex ATPase component TadA [Kiritimatiellia bacterium]MBU4246911.1 Flp pilus assembly complex ATPase component TadA [Verrucomicrobiota bacterium]MBU4291299.1 Flp pilus assembly complex ATPase component TadA [Verrucomicrobiota bacterium]MBU4429944.1 Flp pilus assembly complex ATPase component TadA [Verrucomicrobiota bacterium]